MNPIPFLKRCQTYRMIMETFMARLKEEDQIVHIPALAGLKRHLPNMMFHPNPELFLQHGGCTEFTCPEEHFSLRANEIALIPRGVPHGEKALDRRRSPFQVLVFCLHGNDVMLIVAKASPEGIPVVELCDTFEAPEASQAVRYIDDAAATCLNVTRTAAARRRSLIFAAISVIYDVLEPKRLEGRVNIHNDPRVRRCHELIRYHLPDPTLSVESLAQQLGCTPDHLSRRFRAETGMSVLAYIREQRLARAKDLIQDPKLNISEIAWACGFSSLNYFVRVFRQAVGRPPRQFQRALSPAKHDGK